LCLDSSDFNAKNCRIKHLAEPKSDDDAINRLYVERAISNIAVEVRENTERIMSSVKEVAAESKTANATQTERIRVLENYLGDNVMDIRVKFSEEVGTREGNIKNLTDRIDKIDSNITGVERALGEVVVEVRKNVEKTAISVKTLVGEIAADYKANNAAQTEQIRATNAAQTERIRVLEESVKLMKHYTDFLGDNAKDIQTNLSKEVSTREENTKKIATDIYELYAELQNQILKIEKEIENLKTTISPKIETKEIDTKKEPKREDKKNIRVLDSLLLPIPPKLLNSKRPKIETKEIDTKEIKTHKKEPKKEDKKVILDSLLLPIPPKLLNSKRT